jgi:heme oxygenase (mycobilin-producing)
MRWPKRISIGVGALLALAPLVGTIVAKPAARDADTTPSSTWDRNHMINIDLDNKPNLYFRIDNFSVPDAAREEFEAAMRRNMTFIRTLPGFLGHVVFEKTGGPTAFNIATIAVWENKEALEKASVQVGAYYQRIGFDTASALARWGVKAEVGTFSAPRQLQ